MLGMFTQTNDSSIIVNVGGMHNLFLFCSIIYNNNFHNVWHAFIVLYYSTCIIINLPLKIIIF